MKNYPHLATRLFNAPLLARLETAQQFAAAFDRIAVGEAGLPTVDARVTASGIDRARYDAYDVTESGIGVLTIEGPMVQRAGQISPDCSPITSYQWINTQLMAMAADSKVRGILLEFDTPGGEAANAFELGARISTVQSQSGKPIWAIANETAFSAGYALAAGAERILAPKTAMAGSIGVIMLHVDMSQATKKKGYAFTPIFAGARKNDFSSFEPLSREALAVGQRRVDELYNVFVEHVAAARGIDAAKVRSTEAGIFSAQEAVDLGLIDEVASFDEALAMLAERITSGITVSSSRQVGASATSNTKGTDMDTKQNGTPATTTAITPEQLTAARAEGVTAGKADGIKDGASAERARIKSIMTSDAAKDRPSLANHLAFDTDMGVEQATAMLAKAGVETPAKAANPLDQAMRGSNPKIGVGADGDGKGTGAEGAAPVINTASIYQMRAKAAGHAK